MVGVTMLDNSSTGGVVKHITYQNWDDMQRACDRSGPHAESVMCLDVLSENVLPC